MTEPITTNKSLIVPNTGDLTGAWGTSALNPNFQTIDSMFGGVTTISLSSATTILLTVPATTGVWPGSISQSVNSLIRFTGAQTGSAIIQFTLPGFYIVENKCTGTSSVQLAPASGGGNKIGAPPGKKCHVFFDGTDMDYVDMPEPGTSYDLHTNTIAYPPWMLACTVLPYLAKSGATYSTSVYPALAAILGSTFGGNGITTFGVPDERNRFRMYVDGDGTGRVTTAGSGINGAVLGSVGGSQYMQAHTHTNAITDPGHVHGEYFPTGGGGSAWYVGTTLTGQTQDVSSSVSTKSATTNISVSISSTGLGSSQNMPPTIISMISFIKT